MWLRRLPWSFTGLVRANVGFPLLWRGCVYQYFTDLSCLLSGRPPIATAQVEMKGPSCRSSPVVSRTNDQSEEETTVDNFCHNFILNLMRLRYCLLCTHAISHAHTHADTQTHTHALPSHSSKINFASWSKCSFVSRTCSDNSAQHSAVCICLFVCVEVVRPSQPNGVMSSAVSLPNHTCTGQA